MNWEQSPNQVVLFNSDTVIPVRCFGTDTFGRCPLVPSVPDTFNVTLNVDMRDVAAFRPGTDTVNIAGPFNNWTGQPYAQYRMTDPDTDSIYSITIRAAEPQLQYKARYIQNGVINWEGGANKVVNFQGDTVVPVRCFGNDSLGRCPTPPPPTTPDTFNITLQVDLRFAAGFNYATDSVDVAGLFNNWSPALDTNALMSDANGDSIFTITLQRPHPAPTGTYDTLQYKARYHQSGIVYWEQSPNQIVLFNSDTVIPVRCYGTDTFGRCPIPPQPVPDTAMVTIRVDMRTAPGFTYGSDSVDIAGPFNNWTAAPATNFLLSDANQDSIFEITLPVTSDTFIYKARYIRNGAVLWEQSPDQVVAVPNDTVLPVRCYGSASAGRCPVAQKRRVTFRIDMSDETAFNAGTDTVQLAGFFNGWNPAAQYRLFDADGDLVYEGSFPMDTGSVDYKIRYWSSGSVTWESGGNRNINVTRDSILPVRCFDALNFGVCNPQVFIPTYRINQINGTDAAGRADSAGTVCRLYGTLNSADYRGAGYTVFLHDGTSGIQLYSDTNLSGYANPLPGDSLKVMGTIAQFRGQLRLILDSLQFIASGTNIPVVHQKVNLNESDEGELVRLPNYRLLDPAQWPTTAGVTRVVQITNEADTLPLVVDNNTNIPGKAAPAGYFDVTGVVEQRDSTAPYFEDYVLLPRTYADIMAVPTPKLYISEVMSRSGINTPALDGVWFEIANYGNTAISLQNYRWGRGAQRSNAQTIQNGLTLAPGERAVVVDVSRSDEMNWLTEWKQQGNNLPVLLAGRNFNSFPAVSSKDDRITLWDNQGRRLSSVAYDQSQTQLGLSMLFDSTGAYAGLSQLQVNGAYLSRSGDVGSPGDLHPVGLDEWQAGSLQVYPNPTEGLVQIRWPGRAQARYRILDQTGRIVKAGVMESEKTVVELTDLPSGLYILELEEGSVLLRRKVMKR